MSVSSKSQSKKNKMRKTETEQQSCFSRVFCCGKPEGK